MFEDLVGKKVRILKTDDYTRVGTLISVENKFLKIEHDKTGRVEYINESEVSSIAEVE